MPSFTDPNVIYQTTRDDCNCSHFRMRAASRGEKCKHILTLLSTAEQEADRFLDLRKRFDSRLNGEAHTQYVRFEMMMEGLR